MKKLFLKIGFVLSLGALTLNFSACKDKVKPAETTATDTYTNVDTTAKVVIASDDALKENVKTAIKDYNGVTADVNDGVVTLKGEITRDRLPMIMQAVNNLKPKKVNNQLTIK